MMSSISSQIFLKAHKFSALGHCNSFQNPLSDIYSADQSFRIKVSQFTNILPRTNPSFKSYSRTRVDLSSQMDCNTAKHDPSPSLIAGSQMIIPNNIPVRCSMKRNGIIAGYAVNTNQGLVRTYNEDRVAIVLSIVQPVNAVKPWPKCSFFGIYDGHGGSLCADYLRDNLHQFVIRDTEFPWNPKEALMNGFKKAEERFMALAIKEGKVIERSGSCAVVILIVGDMCYIANVGDSRAVLSV